MRSRSFVQKGPRSGMVRLFINVGGMDNARPGDIAGMIYNTSQIPSGSLGTIDVFEKCSYVEVPEDHVQTVMETVGGAEFADAPCAWMWPTARMAPALVATARAVPWRPRRRPLAAAVVEAVMRRRWRQARRFPQALRSEAGRVQAAPLRGLIRTGLRRRVIGRLANQPPKNLSPGIA